MVINPQSNSLLALPREIRDDILSRVIFSILPAPDATLFSIESGSRDRIEINDIDYQGWKGRNILYPPGNPTVGASSLLRTNRQLHDETIDILRRSRWGKSYVVDIVLLHEAYLWATWLSIPILTTRLDTVHACFRISKSDEVLMPVPDSDADADDDEESEGVEEGGESEGAAHKPQYRIARLSKFRGGCCAPPQIVWIFYSVLERFLRCGPVGPLKNLEPKFDRGITMQVLEIDFASSHAEETEFAMEFPDESARQQQRRYPNSKVMRAEWLSIFVKQFIVFVLSMGSFVAKFGATFYERIGRVRILLDGNLKMEWDLHEELMKLELPVGSSRTVRSIPFEEWRQNTLKVRKENGFY